jgi:hypothetical protein
VTSIGFLHTDGRISMPGMHISCDAHQFFRVGVNRRRLLLERPPGVVRAAMK